MKILGGAETSGVQDCVSCTPVRPDACLNSADIQLVSEHGRPHLRSSINRTLVVHGRVRYRGTSFDEEYFVDAGGRTATVYQLICDQL